MAEAADGAGIGEMFLSIPKDDDRSGHGRSKRDDGSENEPAARTCKLMTKSSVASFLPFPEMDPPAIVRRVDTY